MIERIILPGSELSKLRHLNQLLTKENKRLNILLQQLRDDFHLLGTIEEKYSDLREKNEQLQAELDKLKEVPK